MSALTHLSAIRMMERELLALECRTCGHKAGVHSLRANQCAGAYGRGKPCRCERWVDPDSVLLDRLDHRLP